MVVGRKQTRAEADGIAKQKQLGSIRRRKSNIGNLPPELKPSKVCIEAVFLHVFVAFHVWVYRASWRDRYDDFHVLHTANHVSGIMAVAAAWSV